MTLEQTLADSVLRLRKATSASLKQSAARTAKDLQLLIMTQFFPPDFAATGQLIEELVTQIGEQGVEVKVFTGQPGYAFAKERAPEVEMRGPVQVKRSRATQVF